MANLGREGPLGGLPCLKLPHLPRPRASCSRGQAHSFSEFQHHSTPGGGKEQGLAMFTE